jgi:hypothetical protein
MKCSAEDEIVVGYLLVNIVFFLNGPDRRGNSEVFQVGKTREGERKFDIAAFGRLPWKYIRINCRIIYFNVIGRGKLSHTFWILWKVFTCARRT